MALKFWQVDSFTNEVFKGNPAAVFVLDEPIKDKFMQNIAVEMNLPETAFVELRPGRNPLLRWFTPMDEIDLCGHATLASAHIYFSEINTDAKHITFDTKFVGPLKVTNNRTTLSMDFPLRPGEEVPMHKVPDFVINCLSSIRPVYARKSRDLMLVYENERMYLT